MCAHDDDRNGPGRYGHQDTSAASRTTLIDPDAYAAWLARAQELGLVGDDVTVMAAVSTYGPGMVPGTYTTVVLVGKGADWLTELQMTADEAATTQ